MSQKNNPIIYSDFPDIDIIRIENTYYMVSTTMHFMPGCSVLKSYDLLNWEFVGHVYDYLDDTLNQKLEIGNIYGQGMWAPSFRYHNGMFYIMFAANDTKKTYLFTAKTPEGPWKKSFIDGFYHDASLLFDDDERIYLVYGNTTIHLLELEADLSRPKLDGLSRIIVKDEEGVGLGYEGAHLQKRAGIYYLFLIHWPKSGTKRRKQWCYVSDSLIGEFLGKCIIDDDLGFHNQGVAQGGMVDTSAGDWYLFMFQDRGAVGRVPIIIPMDFEDNYPVVRNESVPLALSVDSLNSDYEYSTLNGDDDFRYLAGQDLKPFWQFNHQPQADLWSVSQREGAFRLTTAHISSNLTHAHNTLTQRTTGPASFASVSVDGSNLKEGDYAGICAFQGNYGAIALTLRKGSYCLVMLNQPAKYEATMGCVLDDRFAKEQACVRIASSTVTLKVAVDFENLKDEAQFYYYDDSQWKSLGDIHKLYFKLDHFTGCRFGLFLYSTEKIGGMADFLNFKYGLK